MRITLSFRRKLHHSEWVTCARIQLTVISFGADKRINIPKGVKNRPVCRPGAGQQSCKKNEIQG